jgi:biopolymer transport protein ExbB
MRRDGMKASQVRLWVVCAGVFLFGAATRAVRAEPGPDAAGQWLDVYKKEYAFLEAERDALAGRLGEVKAESARAIGGAEAKIAKLQRELVEARSAADLDEEKLTVAEREAATADEKFEIVPETIERARRSLEASGLTPRLEGEPASAASDMAALVDGAAALMARQARVEVQPGAFFLRDGTKVEGRLVRLGGVFAWGVADHVAGALAPAGGGRLQLWPDDAAATAEALAQGATPPVLRGLLFDDPQKRIEPRVERSFSEYTTVGGPIAWVIVVVGAVALAFLLLRAWFVLRGGAARRRLGVRLAPILGDARASESGRAALQERLDHAFLAEAPCLERFSTLITVLAAVAPLLGLLGTVTGMIATFDIITEHGNSDPKLLSGGISEALITTEYGLLVAIPTLFLGTLLTGRANRVLTTLERDLLEGVAGTLGREVAAAIEPPHRKRKHAKSEEETTWTTPSNEPSPTFETAAQ